MTIRVCDERPGDARAVWRMHTDAFGRAAEANLVDALRAAEKLGPSLVAVAGEEVVGHIAFSPATIADAPVALGLGPMAVDPRHQRAGIGSALVRHGLAACARAGRGVVVVLGHPAFYPRFGFVPAARHALTCEYEGAGDAFMVAELWPGALGGRCGLVRYRPEFAAV